MKLSIGQITKATTKFKENIKYTDEGHLNLRHITSNGVEGEAINLFRPMFWFKNKNEICPAIILSSNPLLKNKERKPWEDEINIEKSRVHYFGDNKTPGKHPLESLPKEPQTGNQKMVSMAENYLSNDRAKRIEAPPIIIFQHCKVGRQSKGYRKFIGVGYLYNYQLIQQKTTEGKFFANYCYDIKLIDLENNQFDWSWIYDRKSWNPTKNNNLKAPESWKRWMEHGHPENNNVEDLGKVHRKFENQVVEILKSGPINAPIGNLNPDRTLTTLNYFQRNPFVKAWVLQNSNGICEVCNKDAPFNTDQGEFFLEVHHIKALSKGGSDTIENTIALCPNCHREIHHGTNRLKIEEGLFKKIPRIKKEN
ncbi:HNH endonuclease [Euzebyella marina]|uniref:HNH endonuclease n=1 Tax=Euzebyella marina TaxID=1761453 RepID=A0A3G2L9Z7_9FLAO|nr:HNH endonuclease [Euzebyella marina]AYN69076.1 HNH endonuclease [Euzebyella marina]